MIQGQLAVLCWGLLVGPQSAQQCSIHCHHSEDTQTRGYQCTKRAGGTSYTVLYNLEASYLVLLILQRTPTKAMLAHTERPGEHLGYV